MSKTNRDEETNMSLNDALTAACEAYAADPTAANWTALLVADDAARAAAKGDQS